MWSKFDDQFYLNPKNALLSRDEQDLHIAAIIYCNGQLTDGFIPNGALPMLYAWAKLSESQATAKAIAKQLVEHSYWEIAENGYQIHDFLDWNISREDALARKEERSQSGRRGGLARAKAIAKQEPKLNPSKTVPSTRTSTFNTTTTGAKNIFAIYEREIGPLTPMISDKLKQAESDYPAGWVEAALQEAALNNKRNWKYADAILKRWNVDGFQSRDKPERTNGGGKGKLDKSLDAVRQFIAENGEDDGD